MADNIICGHTTTIKGSGDTINHSENLSEAGKQEKLFLPKS